MLNLAQSNSETRSIKDVGQVLVGPVVCSPPNPLFGGHCPPYITCDVKSNIAMLCSWMFIMAGSVAVELTLHMYLTKCWFSITSRMIYGPFG